MKKIFFFTIIFLFLISCSKKTNLVVEKNQNNIKNQYKTGFVSDKDGGPGFEKIAESFGYKTNIGVDYGNPDAKKGGVFHTYLLSYPPVFRPMGINATSKTTFTITQLVYGYGATKGMTKYNSQTGKLERDLIDFWKFSEDKKTAWFRINPKVHFSDGEPFTVDDVIATHNLKIDENLGDPVGKKIEEAYKITKLSPYLMRVDIKDYDWKAWFDFGTYYMPKKYLSKVDTKTFLTKYARTFMPGLGPYVFDAKNSKEGKLLVLKKNPNWWGYIYPENKNKFNFDVIEFQIVPNYKVLKEKFKRGEIDNFLPSADDWYGDFKKQNSNFDPIKRNLILKKILFNASAKGKNVFLFNTLIKPFDNINVRKAVCMGFNKDIMIEKLYHNDYVKYFSQYAFTKYASPNLKDFYKYDPKKAAELLDKAGYNIIDKDGIRKNDKGKRLEFDIDFYSENPDNEKIHIQLQQNMKAIGIKLNLNKTDFNNIVKKLDTHEFNLLRLNFGGDELPSIKPIKDAKDSTWGFVNKEYNDVATKYLSSSNIKERLEYIHKADEIIAKNFLSLQLWVPAYTSRFIYWNKFGTSYPYTGDLDIIRYWYIDPKKEEMLEKAKKDNALVLDEGSLIVDPYNLKPADFNLLEY